MRRRPLVDRAADLARRLVSWSLKRSPRLRRRLWPRMERKSKFVHRYLDGLKGIEIGAGAHNDYGVDALNVDRYSAMDTTYKEAEWDLCGRKRAVDLVAPGDELPFKDDAVDFVLASHVVEHFPDPIRAIKEWVRVARRYVILVVPHRDRTFDHDRDLTPLDELARRHEENFDADGDEHWTVWNLETFLAMCDRFGFEVIDRLDPDDKVGNGFMIAIDAS